MFSVVKEMDEDNWDMLECYTAQSPHIHQSKRLMQQLKDDKKDGLRQIAALAAKETALLPGLLVWNSKIFGGYSLGLGLPGNYHNYRVIPPDHINGNKCDCHKITILPEYGLT